MLRRQLSPFRLAFGLIALLLFVQFSSVFVSAAPAVGSLVVTRLDDPAPDGCQVSDCSLREAIIAANVLSDSDTITFAVIGTIELSIAGANEDSAATGDLDIRYPLIIQGNGITNTLVDGNGLDRVFDVNQMPTRTALGGESVELRAMTIFGGAVTVTNGELGGGGVRAQGNAFTLVDSDVRNNTVTGGRGGGVALNNISAAIANSSLVANSAGDGGAVFVSDSVVGINNSTLSQNIATNGSGTAGGVFHLGSVEGIHHVNFSSSTIADNVGGGFVIQAIGTSAARTNFRNTVVANNTATQCFSVGSGSIEYQSSGYNLTSDGSCNFSQSTDLRNTNPLLGVLQFNHYEPALNSPLLDTGSSPFTFDQLGQPRPADLPGIPNTVDGADRGAYETQSVPTAVTLSSFEPIAPSAAVPMLIILGAALLVGWRVRHLIR